MFMDNFKDLNILICDDSITNVLCLTKLIESEIDVEIVGITDPRKVKNILIEQTIDLILLDLEMPYLSGFDIMADVRKIYESDELPICIITGREGKKIRNQALSKGGNDFINKPIDQIETILRIKNLLKIRKGYIKHEKDNVLLEKKVQQRTFELNDTIDNLLNSLAVAGEMKDDNTGRHVLRVGKYARILAEGYGLPIELMDMIEQSAPLHDIGKIGIPDNILLKPGKLNDIEWKVMVKHTQFADAILGAYTSPHLQMAKIIATSHHERWDGNGYPKKLSGESIPIEGRITAIADVFDALTTKRPYKKAWPIDDAVGYIIKESGKAFDPALITVFSEQLHKITDVRDRLAD